jgi:uncharacterized protein YndB with AHSA1/START domain
METQERLASLRVQRHLAHAPKDVWEALTDPKQVMQWMQAPDAAIDGHKDGHVDIGTHLRITGRILTWDPPRVFEHEFKLPPSKATPAGEDAVMRYELEPDGEGCLLTVALTRLTPATVRLLSRGLNTGLERLVSHLAGRTGAT